MTGCDVQIRCAAKPVAKYTILLVSFSSPATTWFDTAANACFAMVVDETAIRAEPGIIAW